MFRCIPCLSSKGPPWEDITTHLTDMQSQRHRQPDQPVEPTGGSSLDSATVAIEEMAERLKNNRKKKKKQKQKEQQQQRQLMAMGDGGGRQHRHAEGGPLEEEKEGAGEEKQGEEDEEDKEEEYWVAEADPGVLITFAPLPGGGNCIHKIRFREDMFDASEAQKWWSDNCENIVHLYSVQTRHESSPPQSDDEIPGSSSAQESKHTQITDDSVYKSAVSSSSGPADHKTSLGGGHEGRAVTSSKLVEWVVEDQPGVFITVRSLSDGSKQLRRVELSREKFGEVKARVWWEENKDRIHRQYTSRI